MAIPGLEGVAMMAIPGHGYDARTFGRPLAASEPYRGGAIDDGPNETFILPKGWNLVSI